MPLDVDQAKVLAMLLLGGGSFFVGMLPGYMNRRYQRNQLLITFFLCLGAGVLIATSIVHILTEVQQSLPGSSAAIYFCGGFFLVYLVDVIVHYFGVEIPGHSHSHGAQPAATVVGHGSRSTSTGSYGSVDSERESLLGPASSESVPAPVQCPSSSTGKLGLLCALSLHSFLEGLAIGVQDTGGKVLLLITAVACHKYVVGFCLGLEWSEGTNSNRSSTLRALLVSMLIFSLGSVLGIAIGMTLVDFKNLFASSTIPILQAIAGGTLLYVTLSEVLPREKAKYSQRSRAANGIQFVACVLGFTLMAILNVYLSE